MVPHMSSLSKRIPSPRNVGSIPSRRLTLSGEKRMGRKESFIGSHMSGSIPLRIPTNLPKFGSIAP
eukprot:scaffold795_cov375-Prasinococcus_capsulatus_cf.AAC.38